MPNEYTEAKASPKVTLYVCKLKAPTHSMHAMQTSKCKIAKFCDLVMLCNWKFYYFSDYEVELKIVVSIDIDS